MLKKKNVPLSWGARGWWSFREILHWTIREKQFLEVSLSFMICSIEWMKSMKKSSSYVSIWKHLILKSDHSVIMTVLLLSVRLHSIQVTICWVWVFVFSLGGGRDSPLLFDILKSTSNQLYTVACTAQWVYFHL